MSVLPYTPPIFRTTVPSSAQPSAATPTPSQQPPHDNGNVIAEPTPQTLGVISPSARTSFTRVDNAADDTEAQVTQPSSVVSQDRVHRSPSEASPLENGSEQSSSSLQGLPPSAGTTEPDASVPLASMPTKVDESASQKASVQGQDVPQTPQAFVTFLLVSGKTRTMSFEPETTIGRVKELVWNTWPSEWKGKEGRPPAPSYLRIVYLGKMLQDDENLTKLRIVPSLPAAPQPTIAHLLIRPYGSCEVDGAVKKKRKTDDAPAISPDADPRAGCCRCIIC